MKGILGLHKKNNIGTIISKPSNTFISGLKYAVCHLFAFSSSDYPCTVVKDGELHIILKV